MLTVDIVNSVTRYTEIGKLPLLPNSSLKTLVSLGNLAAGVVKCSEFLKRKTEKN